MDSDNIRETISIIKEYPQIFARKFAFTVPTGIAYSLAIFFMALWCFTEDVPSVSKYIIISVLLYICLIFPVNILIRFRQAHERELDFIEFILEDVMDEESPNDTNEVFDGHVKTKKKYGMSEEELRCFALQCNDYVEKQELEGKEE